MYLYIIACVQYISARHTHMLRAAAAARTMMVFQDKEDNKNVMSLNKMEKKCAMCVCVIRVQERII